MDQMDVYLFWRKTISGYHSTALNLTDIVKDMDALPDAGDSSGEKAGHSLIVSVLNQINFRMMFSPQSRFVLKTFKYY